MESRSVARSSRSARWLLAALILLNIGGGIYFLAPQTVGNQIRRHLQARLQAHYPHLKVQIAAGRVAKDGVLILEGIQFDARPQGGTEPLRPILQIDRLTVVSDMQWDRVFDATMPIRPRKIMIDGLVADLWQDSDGRWSPEQLWPPLVVEDHCPRVQLRDARIRLHSPNQTRPLELDHINVVLERSDHPAVAATADQGVVKAETPAPAVSRPFNGRFMITAEGTFVDKVRLAGEVAAGQLSLRGDAAGLRIDPQVVRQLPFVTAERQEHLAGLSLLSDVQWSVAGPLSSLATWTSPAPAAATDAVPPENQLNFTVNWAVRDGRFDHASLPQPLEKLSARIAMHAGGVDVQWAQAQFGDAALRLSATIEGWHETAAIRGRLSANGLLVNERLARKLPPSVGEAWDKLRPTGPIDLDLQMARLGGVWVTQGMAELQGVDVQLSRFPYPVSQLIGKLHFNDSTAWSEGLSGRIGGQRLSVAFEESLPGHHGATWLQLAADGPVPIDSPLLAALTPYGEPTSPLEEFVRSLSPSGSIHLVAARFDRDERGNPRKSLDLRVSGGALRYKEFPYPLYEVRGQITVHDNWVRLIGFQASNSDNARIRCEGSFLGMPDDAPHPTDGKWQLALRFQGRDLPLDESLRAALSENSRQIWDSLSPTGVLDQIEVTVHHADNWKEPRLTIAAHQHPRPTIDNRTVSLRAAEVPYRLDLIEGAVRFDGNKVIIDGLDCRHDSTRIAADGSCDRTANGQWRLDLNIHSGSRLHPDAELIASLPAEVRGTFQRLQLRGPLSARGTVSVMLPDERHLDPIVDWAVTLQLEGNRIGDVGPVHDIRGEISMQGKRDSAAVVADGVVQIDSMHIESQQITAIQGPFAIRDDRLLLGESLVLASTTGIRTPVLRSGGPVEGAVNSRPIQGNLFGGQLTLSGDVVLSDGAFDVVLSAHEVDVATALLEIGQPDSSVSGKAQGQLRLEGVVGAAHLLKGSGTAKLSEASLYQLPLLISVFNMLRVKPSESVAFTDGEARFSIDGDNVTFNELNLWGDLIALHGTGTLNRSHEMNLSFNTRVSPHNIWSHVARPFGDNQYTLWTLSVKGPVSNPQIERRAMETVGGTIERLLPGIAAPGANPAPPRVGWLRERISR